MQKKTLTRLYVTGRQPAQQQLQGYFVCLTQLCADVGAKFRIFHQDKNSGITSLFLPV